MPCTSPGAIHCLPADWNKLYTRGPQSQHLKNLGQQAKDVAAVGHQLISELAAAHCPAQVPVICHPADRAAPAPPHPLLDAVSAERMACSAKRRFQVLVCDTWPTDPSKRTALQRQGTPAAAQAALAYCAVLLSSVSLGLAAGHLHWLRCFSGLQVKQGGLRWTHKSK